MNMERYNKPEPGRLLPLEGAHNLRDLGGYPAGAGRRLRWGKLYRAGDLHRLSPGDRAFLEARNIKTIVDFRGDRERKAAPDVPPATLVQTFELPIDAASILDLCAPETKAGGEALMQELYGRMVVTARPQYRHFFRILGDPAHTPLLFHCSAGKDRTGLAAAFILAALGVDRERIYEDYLLSAVYLKEAIRQWLRAAPHLEEAVLSVRRGYLDAAFARIDAAFGGINRYVQEELGADAGMMREWYTETAP
ncbi:MAG: tyrosine-protein phosphatase [Treponema sp.]|jgi:protein-tyrosine phosphatase|nr:tyrosine-protein phosphatase [Treponema sp.]